MKEHEHDLTYYNPPSIASIPADRIMGACILGSTQHDQKFTLQELGISSCVGVDGKQQFTIQLDQDKSPGSRSPRAIFDRSTGRWCFSTSEATSHPLDTFSTQLSLSNPSSRWIDLLPKNEDCDWFLSGVDWSLTGLGPLETWPVSLRTAVNLLLAEPGPAVIYWGPSLCACFNARAYEDIATRLKAPHDIQGKPFKEVWNEVWPDLEVFYNAMQELKQGMKNLNVAIFPEQDDGRREETFWDGAVLPIRGEDGKVAGFYHRARETTIERVKERRANTLYAISAFPDHVKDSVWQHVLHALGTNEQDFPMAFAYSAEDSASSCVLTLQQSLGLPADGHPLVPQQVDIYDGSTGFPFYYRKVKATHRPLVIHCADGSLPETLLDGFAWRGYGERPVSLVFVPVSVSSRLLGIIVFGWNPRRQYRPEDDAFINALCRQVSATIAFAIDWNETRQWAERMTMQLADRDKQIREIAEHGPVGMVRLTPAGNIVWANSQFYAITDHPVVDQYEYSFTDVLHPEDRDVCMGYWSALVDQGQSVEQEFRLNRKWLPPPTTGNPNPQEEHCWILSNAFPVMENGVVQSVVGCITDISRTKWAEEVQSRLAIEATEARRLQEAFIDVVSHEMRNPLSAITQLADGIAACLDDFKPDVASKDDAISLLREKVENAKTILLCAAHQKRIIDDVLTLSKLDAQLLSITPVVVQPHVVVDSALTMFRAEFERNAITVDNIADETYSDFGIDWVTLDPSRLMQIFINLLTNAIKFTKLEDKRKITVRRSAFESYPPPELKGVQWFPSDQGRTDIISSPEWGDGKPVYLLFSVTDTGKGMEQEEMSRLFHRFQQGTEKTHVKYGGSGLGLFVSRELTENMGGEIGVVSAPGKGSTFAFYVRARKADAPQELTHVSQSQSPAAASPSTPRRASLSLSSGRQRTASIKSPPQQQQQQQVHSGTSSIMETERSPRPVRVLLVEDNTINAQVLTKQLEGAGCTVYTANHGAEALDFLPRLKAWAGPTKASYIHHSQDTKSTNPSFDMDIDCILMDIEMPVLDGLSCTRRIREIEQQGLLGTSRKIPIIAITANARAGQIDAAFEAGVDAVLPKPFRAVDVLWEMDALVHHSDDGDSDNNKDDDGGIKNDTQQ
ncbi:hypothetical protein ABEF93_001826 [Exophiala dermatitidis]